MKYLFLFLLTPFFLTAQQDTTIKIGASSNVFDVITIYPVYSDYEQVNPIEYLEKRITFADENGFVSFREGQIFYGIRNSVDTINCDYRIFNLIDKVFSSTQQEQSERLSQLQLKVYWYEKHFGTLEGDMNDDCIEFNPVKNPPNIQPCKK